jgi:murein DD-endopeptidase MepM/ murein hydrolase activator NlpD
MPHRAIDYAAATGTPVKAVADGTVSFAGWKGGFGNYIDIRHGSVYQTQYAHLSKILVSPGESVKQGDIIGKVGSTGFSTGPHLHYQVKVHGELTNPGEVEFPKGDSISDELMEEFYKQKKEVDKLR